MQIEFISLKEKDLKCPPEYGFHLEDVAGVGIFIHNDAGQCDI